MELKPGYKETEVGVIPQDWDVVQLGQVTDKVGSGITPTGGSRVYKDSGRPFIRSQNVGWGNLDLSDVAFIDDATHATFEATQIRGSDVFLNITGASIGRSAMADSRIEGGNVNQHVCIIRADQGKLAPDFLCSFLISSHGQRQIDSFQAGGNRQGLNFGQVRSIRIAIPETTDEQRVIVTALGDVDTLLDGLDRLIAKKRDLKMAVMQQLLTGKTRLPGFEKKWEYRSLIEIAEFQKSNFEDGDWIEAEHITDRGIRLIQTGNIGIGSFVEKEVRKYIYEKSFRKLRCKELRVGDILICRLAEPAGRACIFPNIGEERVITSVDVTIFRPREEIANRRFIVQYCSTEYWFNSVLDSVGGTTHRRISRGALGKLLIPFPSIKEQTAIAQVLSDMDAEIATLEQRRTKTKDIKQAMMQELLTGKTRLVTPGISNV